MTAAWRDIPFCWWDHSLLINLLICRGSSWSSVWVFLLFGVLVLVIVLVLFLLTTRHVRP